ncbi:MAG TPA: hypothetical protein P5121_31750, partial [Caldilineaceae bacterium]|nr:hypothetical protein [Caldilineaceae bacterium]
MVNLTTSVVPVRPVHRSYRIYHLMTDQHRKWPILLLVLLGVGLRFARLSWQPLWADEGYSLYFATEPLLRMLWLTANDIHPPLYYALLHLWTVTLAGTDPLL